MRGQTQERQHATIRIKNRKRSRNMAKNNNRNETNQNIHKVRIKNTNKSINKNGNRNPISIFLQKYICAVHTYFNPSSFESQFKFINQNQLADDNRTATLNNILISTNRRRIYEGISLPFRNT